MYQLEDFTNGHYLFVNANHISSIRQFNNVWNGHDVLDIVISFISGNIEHITLLNTQENKDYINKICKEKCNDNINNL